MMKFIPRFMVGVLFVLAAPLALAQEEGGTKAAVLYHPATDTFAIEQNADMPLGPASLTKLMTLYLLFDAIEQGQLSLDSELPISEKAWRMGGSKMFVEVGKMVKVEDLIRGIAISSGNDACVVVAEYLGGTEDGFANLMNAAAQKLGMQNSYFTNASGWPDPEQHVTARDMAILAAALMRDFPDFYGYFGETTFTYNEIKQQNRNGLLRRNVGVDGLKTGHTEEDGFHLVASGQQQGVRLISVAMGTGSFGAREGENLKLLRQGWTQFSSKTLWTGGSVMAQVPVWLGTQATINVGPAQNTDVFAPRTMAAPQVTVSYAKPIPAPVTVGTVVGKMTTSVNGKTYEVDLVALEDVGQADMFGQFMQKLFYRLGLEHAD